MRIQNGEIDCREHECPEGCDICQLCLYYYSDCLWKSSKTTKKPKKTKAPKVKKTKTPKKSKHTKLPETKKTKAPTVKKTKKPKKPKDTKLPKSKKTKTPTMVKKTKKPKHTKSPETKATKLPTVQKTKKPKKSKKTSKSPTLPPNTSPSDNPIQNPTLSPTSSPSDNPMQNPTSSPTSSPSENPMQNPTSSPTNSPLLLPSDNPTLSIPLPQINLENPTNIPSSRSSGNPTSNITLNPTSQPMINPINNPVEYLLSATPSPSNTLLESQRVNEKPSIDCNVQEDFSFDDTKAPDKLDLFFLYDIEYRNSAIQEYSLPETMGSISDQIMAQMIASLFPQCASKQRKLSLDDNMGRIVGLRSNTFSIKYDESCIEPFDSQISSCSVVRNHIPVLLSQKIETHSSDGLSQALISMISDFNFQLNGGVVKSIRRDNFITEQPDTSFTTGNDENLNRSSDLELSSTSSDTQVWVMVAGGSFFIILLGVLARFRSRNNNERSLLVNEEELAECYDDRGEDLFSQTTEASSKANCFSICGGSFVNQDTRIYSSSSLTSETGEKKFRYNLAGV